MASELILDSKLESAKNMAWWLYIVHGVSFVFSLGAFSFIPLIVNYVKRPETEGTFVHSHHDWQIRSFWWYLVWMVVGGALVLSFFLAWLGFAVLGVAWLWKAYRLIKGFFDLNANRAAP